MPDGCRLAARIWLPEDADSDPVPAILEYIPYRKNDGTAIGDSTRHAYFAGHGYASVRVDMRGRVLHCPWRGWQLDLATGEGRATRTRRARTEAAVEKGEVVFPLGRPRAGSPSRENPAKA
jgi:nitrite reductase/ring-hydroxylating ferredoxin subunit